MTIEEYISDLRYYYDTGLGTISSYEAGELANALEGLLTEYKEAFATILRAFRDNPNDQHLRVYMLKHAAIGAQYCEAQNE
jgi:hypothetical protein